MSEPSKNDLTDTVILSVALVSGRFKSEIRVPLFGDPTTAAAAMGQWVDMIETGFRVGATNMTAILSQSAQRGKDRPHE